jgi:DNA polymerase III subunit epsilon
MAAIVFFDTETTGLPQWKAGAGHPKQPHIMQLGAILQDADTRKNLMELNLLLKLPEEVEPEPKAVEVHKITKEMCETYGVYPQTALKLFDVMLKKAQVVVAHNLNFDALMYEAAVLRDQFLSMASFRDCRHSCTMLNSTPICKIPGNYNNSYKWPTLKEAHSFFFPQVPWNEEGAHDAMYDVRECQAIYWALQDRLRQL